MITAILTCIGSVTSAWAAYAVGSILYALSKSCDVKTASTPKLPRGAFNGKVVWITGGSSGIGREMALLLADRGARLILSSRTKQDLDSVAMECKERNGKAEVKTIPIDLSDKDSLRKKAIEASEAFGSIDVLINNAGISTRVMAAECPVQVDEFLNQVDYLSHVAITKEVIPQLEKNKDARIINSLSVCSKVGVPSRTAYCGAKFALKGWMDSFRIECILRGLSHIHILNVCIGSTNTSLSSRALTGVASDGSVETFDGKDENLLKGLCPSFVAERMLTASFHKSVDESWIAKGKELILMYLNQYIPETAFRVLAKSVAKKYAFEKNDQKMKKN